MVSFKERGEVQVIVGEGSQVLGEIIVDENLTQPYVVTVGGEEVFRANTLMKAQSFVLWHHKNGTLPVAVTVKTIIVKTTVIKTYPDYIPVMLVASVVSLNDSKTSWQRYNVLRQDQR